jgi:D-alanine-D-alanine ligase-like ATP-grasp enzyme
MALETDYVKYALSLTFALVSIISLNLLDFSNPQTFAVLLTAPILFGYTAYISRDSFQKSSFLAAAALPFATFGNIFAAFAVMLLMVNILVSFFASGQSFRSFYGVTSLPLLGAGVLASLLLFSMVMTQPAFAAEVENTTAGVLGEQTERFIEQSNIIDMQRRTRTKMIGSIGESSIGLTQAYVLNETRENLSAQDQRAVMRAFSSAQEDVPERMKSKANRSVGINSIDFSEKSEELVKNIFVKEMFLLFIPLIAFGVYGLHPVVGIATAIAGVLFRELDGYLEGTGE